jgi:hypothetical protein
LVENQPGLRLSVAGIPDKIRSWLRERDQRIVEVIPLAIMTPKNNPLLSRDTDPPVTAAENPSLSNRIPPVTVPLELMVTVPYSNLDH